jgi:3',5'-cyclic AMP phosphodiesterase CpdA
MRIVLVSDTHGFHRQLDAPSGDLLIHAGDFTVHSKPSIGFEFNGWLGSLPHRHKLIIPGNHEYRFEEPDSAAP